MIVIVIIMENGIMIVELKLCYNIAVTNIAIAIIIKSFQFSYKF